MARTSKKQVALQAALNIIEEARSPEALTYDSLSAATGMSKSGLIYHFPTRHDMFVQLHQWYARRWEENLVETAGIKLPQIAGIDPKTTDEEAFAATVEQALTSLSELEKSQALLKNLSFSEPVAELLMTIHAGSHPDFAKPWEGIEKRWMPDATQKFTDLSAADPAENRPLSSAAGIIGKGLGGLSSGLSGGLSKIGGFRITKADPEPASKAETKPESKAEKKANAPAIKLDPADAELVPLLLTVLGSGLWAFDHINTTSLSAENRQKLVDFALRLQN